VVRDSIFNEFKDNEVKTRVIALLCQSVTIVW